MQDNGAIHSHKPLTEYLSDLNIILGIISVLVFILSLIFKIDHILIAILCLVVNIISIVIIVVVSLVYNKNIMHYHIRAFLGFFLALIPFIAAILTGK